MVEHQKENFLYEHFTELCEILKGYDVALFLASGLRPNAIYDANDHAHIAELHEMKQLIHVANKGFVQIVTEGPGHIPLHKINEHVKEHTYICKNTPFFTLGLTVTDVAGKHDYIASAIGNAQVAWLGAALISCNAINDCNHNDELNNSYEDKINDSVPNNSYDNNKQMNDDVQVNDMVQNNIVAHKIAAHAADIAKGHPGAQVRDNALSKARKEGRTNDVIKLGF
jgi:phosphomethylpyrimidine synthase